MKGGRFPQRNGSLGLIPQTQGDQEGANEQSGCDNRRIDGIQYAWGARVKVKDWGRVSGVSQGNRRKNGKDT